ncbi:MAG: hypothetical protein KDK25_13820 [Leptospiraceae bacterium]|nr:hypothetical protein [Leptospiraceae bacterium]MCB1171418.1 hypothetical protein [Leptospiraceae bacterium]
MEATIRSSFFASDMRHLSRKRRADRHRNRRFLLISYGISILLIFSVYYAIHPW